MDRRIDPVCRGEVDPERAGGESEHQGKKYYFCSPRCRESFEKEPSKYVENTTAPSKRRGCCGS